MCSNGLRLPIPVPRHLVNCAPHRDRGGEQGDRGEEKDLAGNQGELEKAAKRRDAGKEDLRSTTPTVSGRNHRRPVGRAILAFLLALIFFLSGTVYASTSTIRPNGVGTNDAWTQSGGSSKWNAVSDNTDNTFVYSQTKSSLQDFTISDWPNSIDTITSVQIRVRAMALGSGAAEKLTVYSTTDGWTNTRTEINGQTITRNTWNNYTGTAQTKAPDGGSWTIAKLNALQVRLNPSTLGSGEYMEVSEVYVIVVYTVGNSDPTVNSPSDQSVNEGTSVTIGWIVIDAQQTSGPYTVYRNGTKHGSGTWSNNTNINYVAGKNAAHYTWRFVIQASDGQGGSNATDMVDVHVNPVNPSDNSPADQEWTYGTTGHTIDWVVTDPGSKSGTYNVYRNGTKKTDGATWTNNTNLAYSVDGTGVGSWNFTIEYWDGNCTAPYLTDLVYVTVQAVLWTYVSNITTDSDHSNVRITVGGDDMPYWKDTIYDGIDNSLRVGNPAKVTVAANGDFLAVVKAKDDPLYLPTRCLLLKRYTEAIGFWNSHGAGTALWYGCAEPNLPGCHFDISHAAKAGATHAGRLLIALWDSGYFGLWDSTQAWTTDAYADGYCVIDGGTNVGFGFKITGNSPTRLWMDDSIFDLGWYSISYYPPDSTTQYLVWSNLNTAIPEETAEGPGSGNNTLLDTGRFGAMVLDNMWCLLVSGTGAGQSRKILSNTDDELTLASDWDTSPDNTTVYVVLDHNFPEVDSTATYTNAIVVLQSDDHGATWSDPIVVATDTPSAPELTIAVGEAAGTYDQVLLLWWLEGGGTITGRKSTDQGDTWAAIGSNPTATGSYPQLFYDTVRSKFCCIYVTTTGGAGGYEILTADLGTSWSAPASLGFALNPDFDADMAQPTGIIYIVMNKWFGPIQYVVASKNKLQPLAKIAVSYGCVACCPKGSGDEMEVSIMTGGAGTADLYEGLLDDAHRVLVGYTKDNQLKIRMSDNHGSSWSNDALYEPVSGSIWMSTNMTFDFSEPFDEAGTKQYCVMAAIYDYGSHSLWDTSKTGWYDGLYANGYVLLTSGTGSGQGAYLLSNYPRRLWLNDTYLPNGWLSIPGGTRPDTTTVYGVYGSGSEQDTGVADSSSGKGLIHDGTKSWTADEWIGYRVLVCNGTGAGGEWRTITDNDATSLTVSSDFSDSPYGGFYVILSSTATETGTISATDGIVVRTTPTGANEHAGKNWTDPVPVAMNVKSSGPVNLSITVGDKTGQWDYVLVVYDGDSSTIRGRRSSDAGSTWSTMTNNVTGGTNPTIYCDDGTVYMVFRTATGELNMTFTNDWGNTAWAVETDLNIVVKANHYDAEVSKHADLHYIVNQSGTSVYMEKTDNSPILKTPDVRVAPGTGPIGLARIPETGRGPHAGYDGMLLATHTSATTIALYRSTDLTLSVPEGSTHPHPSDQTWLGGTTGHYIYWTLTSWFDTSGAYTVYKNSTYFASGSYTNATYLSISIDGLGGGVWNFTINGEDSYWNATDTVIVTVTAPYEPSDPCPSSGAIVRPSLNLSWTGGHPDPKANVTYHIYLGTDSNPPYWTNTTYTNISKWGLHYDTTYFWKVSAKDDYGASTEGDVWNFTIPMGYGYYQVYDMNISGHYDLPYPWNTTGQHIANAANQSNLVVISDRCWYADFPWTYHPNYPQDAVKNGLGFILDVHTVFRYWWFDVLPGTSNETRVQGAEDDCGTAYSGLGDYKHDMEAIMLFDEPIRFYDGNHNMNASKMATMVNIAREFWHNETIFLDFHRQGDAEAEGFYFWDDQTGYYYNMYLTNSSQSARTLYMYEEQASSGQDIVAIAKSRVFSIEGWSSAFSNAYINISFWYQVKSDNASATNAYVELRKYEDNTYTSLHNITLVPEPTLDTTWKKLNLNVSTYLAGVTHIDIRLLLHDNTSTNYHLEAWLDDVRLFVKNTTVEDPKYYKADRFDYDYLVNFDSIACYLVEYCNWIAIDPYPHPYWNASYSEIECPSLSIISEDAYWAKSFYEEYPLIIFGQAYDPPESTFPIFFDEDNLDDGAFVMPDNTTTEEYYDVCKTYDAKALIWFWYPDSYASSRDTTQYNLWNVWPKHKEIWEKVMEED